MNWLHRYAQLVAASTFVLIVAGALVTSTGSGLAVPDWPTSYGYFMFSFPRSHMVGGILFEHGHRLIASTVGLLTIGLATWLWWHDSRRWVARLGLVALAAVVLQGVLGGITVLYMLPTPVSVSHAGLAQIFFCLTVSLAVVTSPRWRVTARRRGADGPVDDAVLRKLTLGVTALVYVQILAGALMRHTGAGLAIPDFPLAFGGLFPPEWTQGIAIHYAHRVGALIVALAALAVFGHVRRRHRGRRELTRPAGLLVALVFLQGTLGALVVLSGAPQTGWYIHGYTPVWISSAHVAGGALVLATSLVLTLRVWRVRFRDLAERRERAVTAAGGLRLGSSLEARP